MVMAFDFLTASISLFGGAGVAINVGLWTASPCASHRTAEASATFRLRGSPAPETSRMVSPCFSSKV
jgi:hypothetical protein